MTLTAQWDVAEHGTFIRKVQQALVKAAIAVAAEDAQTANHAKRVAFGNKALLDSEAYARKVAHGVCTNASVTADSSDSDIEFTVNSMFNAYALDSV